VEHISEDFIRDLHIPPLPPQVPLRLERALRDRVEALLFRLKEANAKKYVEPLEIRLVRDAHRVVLTAYELGVPEAEVWYASFRGLVEELGYERVDVGFAKKRGRL